MNPINSGIPAQHYATSTNVSQPSALPGSGAQHSHLTKLPPAKLSRNAQLALDQLATQSNVDHQRVASVVRNALQDGALRLQSTDQIEATYQASVNLPADANPMNFANLISSDLTIKTQLNDQSQYDIIGIDLDGTSLSAPVSIKLSCRPPAPAHDETSPPVHQQSSLVSNHIDAQHSRGQLAAARFRQNQDFSGPPLSSIGSFAPQYMASSHYDPTAASTGTPGPTRHQAAPTARVEPYPTSLGSGGPSSRPESTRTLDHRHSVRTLFQNPQVATAGALASPSAVNAHPVTPAGELEFLKSPIHKQMESALPTTVKGAYRSELITYWRALESKGQDWMQLRGDDGVTRPIPLENAINDAIRNKEATEVLRAVTNNVYGLELRGFSGRKPPKR